MQLIKLGPEVPERLLQAHEEGRVVFFCGAGISYPANLPGFGGLVDKVCQGIGHTPNDIEEIAIKDQRFDTAIGLFENNLMGGRAAVRRAIVDALKPDYSKQGATQTHESLLVLGRTRDRRMRLITTNFDRIFEDVIRRDTLTTPIYQAPHLPIPKARWDGLVYLHGLISSQPTDSELDRLVVSSGDFGLAYLSERWASRFVSELFRNFTVCFVGYSINDPVLRYMTDALAADRILGESPPEMFAFAGYKAGAEATATREWRAKGVTPLLYGSDSGHGLLHETIRSWAATFRDGVNGKGQIVTTCAPFRPQASTADDDFVGRMLWAIADMGGLPARIFSELNPCPDIAWLESLSDERFRHGDLPRFGVFPAPGTIDKDMTFSLLRRPPQSARAQLMSLTYFTDATSSLDPVLFYLAKWLLRHLNEPALIHWIAKRGGVVHSQFAHFINDKLQTIHKLEIAKDQQGLDIFLKASPNGIPGPAMRTLWRLLLAGKLKHNADRLEIYNWKERVARDGVTPSIHMELKSILSPRVEIRKPFHAKTVSPDDAAAQTLGQIAEAEVKLSTENAESLFKWEEGQAQWQAGLPRLLSTFTDLLIDALELLREIGQDNAEVDFSHIYYRSLGKTPRRSLLHGWTPLIELARISYESTLIQAPTIAGNVVRAWWSSAFIPMKRLALYAASKDEAFDVSLAATWLTSDDRKWLFHPYTLNESRAILRNIAPRMDAAQISQLQEEALNGPPRSMFWESMDEDSFQLARSRHIWEFLTSLKEIGAILIPGAASQLAELVALHPEWGPSRDDDESDEDGWVTSANETKGPIPPPNNTQEIIKWLQSNPTSNRPFTSSSEDWTHWCRERFLSCAIALVHLAKRGIWPEHRWSEALRSWSSDTHLQRAWIWLSRLLAEAPDEVVLATAWWAKDIAKKFDGQEEVFLAIIKRILAASNSANIEREDILTAAINHTAGYAAEAAIDWWMRGALRDNQRLDQRQKDCFDSMLDLNRPSLRPARVILGANLLALFRVDSSWTEEQVIPLFSWSTHPDEAPFAWAGFLWGPRLYRPLIEKLKTSFLECAPNYPRLEKKGVQYAALLTYVGLDPGDLFTDADLTTAIHALTQDGISKVANTLASAIEGAEEQRDAYWKNRVRPFILKYYPKKKDLNNDAISNSFAEICSLTAQEFADAFVLLGPWLRPVKWPDSIIKNLLNDNVPSQSPDAVLAFLTAILSDDTYWGAELGSALEKIHAANAAVSSDPRYMALKARLRH